MRKAFIFVAILAVAVGSSSAQTAAKLKTPLLKQLQESITKAQAFNQQTNINVSESELYHLAEIAGKIKPKDVDDKTLDDLMSLVDSTYVSTRFWAVTALGNLGPRAKSAAPKLLSFLPSADCEDGPITMATAVRMALPKMGVKPPSVDYSKCVRIPISN